MVEQTRVEQEPREGGRFNAYHVIAGIAGLGIGIGINAVMADPTLLPGIHEGFLTTGKCLEVIRGVCDNFDPSGLEIPMR